MHGGQNVLTIITGVDPYTSAFNSLEPMLSNYLEECGSEHEIRAITRALSLAHPERADDCKSTRRYFLNRLREPNSESDSE